MISFIYPKSNSLLENNMILRRFFSTMHCPKEDRLRIAKEAFHNLFYHLDVVNPDNHGPAGELSEVSFNQLSIVKTRSDAFTITRGKSSIRRDTTEYFVFVFPTRGNLSAYKKNSSGLYIPGQTIILPSYDEHVLKNTHDVDTVTLKIPASSLRRRIKNIDDIARNGDILNPLLAPAVCQLALQLHRFDSKDHADQLQAVLLELTALMLETRHAVPLDMPTRRALSDITYERLIGYLRENYRDPDLNPARVAEAHRLSLRHLHRIFQINGQTFGQVLMVIRLTEARRMLEATLPSRERPSIGEIAFMCGFNNQAHFSARFRECFGETPRSVVNNGPSSCFSQSQQDILTAIIINKANDKIHRTLKLL